MSTCATSPTSWPGQGSGGWPAATGGPGSARCGPRCPATRSCARRSRSCPRCARATSSAPPPACGPRRWTAGAPWSRTSSSSAAAGSRSSATRRPRRPPPRWRSPSTSPSSCGTSSAAEGPPGREPPHVARRPGRHSGGMPRGRLVLLSTSPRVAPGLLSHDAWQVLTAGRVVAADDGHPLASYVDAAGAAVEPLPADGPAALAGALLDAAREDPARPVVYLLDPAGDYAFTRALSARLVEGTGETLPEVEVLPGSYDLPGARLLDLVATMDRLRSPGGCPWDAEQTHESLATYLVEETYEALEAIETGDLLALRDELGDVLLQVAFHARVAQERTDDTRWTIDDVAAGIVEKLVRRHPHVFGDVSVSGADEVVHNWDRIKAAEKAERDEG